MFSFNSLQTGKWILTDYVYTDYVREVLFQFPSNGKVDPNPRKEWNQHHIIPCFNSLQTGKWILTNIEEFEDWLYRKVSIPFKRENGS